MGRGTPYQSPINHKTRQCLARKLGAYVEKNAERCNPVFWETEKVRRQKSREKRGLHEIPEVEEEDYHKTLAETRDKLSIPEAPAMPLVQQANASMHGETRSTQHQEKVAPIGFVSDEWFALVHTPVKNWQNVPEARKAVDK